MNDTNNTAPATFTLTTRKGTKTITREQALAKLKMDGSRTGIAARNAAMKAEGTVCLYTVREEDETIFAWTAAAAEAARLAQV